MSNQLNRYHNPTIVEHLSSQYVVGGLTPRVRSRVESLTKTHHELAEQIHFWQNRFVQFDEQTHALEPQAETWLKISEQLDLNTREHTQIETPKNSFSQWLQSLFNLLSQYKMGHALSIALIVGLVYIGLPLQPNQDALSYVAVMTNKTNQAHIVASTYGESQKLILNIIEEYKTKHDQSLELWVVSKTDHEARSLALIPSIKNTDSTVVEMQLTLAQWRLIKDSHSLIITVEEHGGSAIGEPSDEIISQGLCVQLESWQTKA